MLDCVSSSRNQIDRHFEAGSQLRSDILLRCNGFVTEGTSILVKRVELTEVYDLRVTFLVFSDVKKLLVCTIWQHLCLY